MDVISGSALKQDRSHIGAYAKIGVSVEKPVVVVARSDGYVGCMTELREGPFTVQALNSIFGGFVTKALRKKVDKGIMAQ